METVIYILIGALVAVTVLPAVAIELMNRRQRRRDRAAARRRTDLIQL